MMWLYKLQKCNDPVTTTVEIYETYWVENCVTPNVRTTTRIETFIKPNTPEVMREHYLDLGFEEMEEGNKWKLKKR